ncbi:MAG TPA: radical SAM protein [Gemmatimonadaceae bacterium]|nr:radical SAM protein [Gemmatimonadaceae bacterium]
MNAADQPVLFAAVPRPPRVLPTLDVQADIRYLAATARSMVNPPAATGMPFWSINPYVGCAFGCAYCYARYTHRYVMERAAHAGALDADMLPSGDAALPPWLAFERRILVKQEAAALLRRALRPGRPAWRAIVERGEPVAIGTATDPYQPAERRFGITRALLGVLAEHVGLRIGLITKSALVTRDAALLGAIARRSRLAVHVSLVTVDRELARRIEPRAPTPEARLRAVRRLREAGVDVGVNCMPVLPGITDRPAQLRALVRAVAEAGATHLDACALRLRSSARQRYLPWLAEAFPELAARYRAAYASSHQPGERYRQGLRRTMTRLCAEHELPFGAWRDEDALREAGREMREAGRLPVVVAGVPGARQLELEISDERNDERRATSDER